MAKSILDAVYDCGIGKLEMLITRPMIASFNIETSVCHNDTTTASVYGDCNNNSSPEAMHLAFGFNKKHRDDLKQLLGSLPVSSDNAFPLFQQSYSGNTADVITYVKQWLRLIDLLDDREFLYVADPKLASRENMAYINDYDGFFIAPRSCMNPIKLPSTRPLSIITMKNCFLIKAGSTGILKFRCPLNLRADPTLFE